MKLTITHKNKELELSYHLADSGNLIITTTGETNDEKYYLLVEPMSWALIAEAFIAAAGQYLKDEKKKRQLSDLKDYIRDCIQNAVNDIKRYIDQTNEINEINRCQDAIITAFDLLDQYQKSNDPRSRLNGERIANAVITSSLALRTLDRIGATKVFGAYMQSVSLIALALTLEYKYTKNKNEILNLENPVKSADLAITNVEKEIDDLLQFRLNGVSEISEFVLGEERWYQFNDRINPGFAHPNKQLVEGKRNERINWYISLKEEAIKNVIFPAKILQSQWHGLINGIKKLSA